ncbi:MAG: hypothetical protein MUP41_09625, partial [Desulfobacterales bacterium]|nr:hypothetical protein [Desulfobacterales bacterium]
DMIYHNQPSDRNKQGETGYTWVDLSNCEIKKGGFTVIGALKIFPRKPDAIYLNTLVYHKGQLWAVEFVDGFGFSLKRWIDHERMETCQWYF